MSWMCSPYHTAQRHVAQCQYFGAAREKLEGDVDRDGGTTRPPIVSLLSAHRGASAERDVGMDSGKREEVVARHVGKRDGLEQAPSGWRGIENSARPYPTSSGRTATCSPITTQCVNMLDR